MAWSSAPLTNSLVQKSLSSLNPQPNIITALTEDLTASPGNLLQWSTYDAIEHDLTHMVPSGSKVLSSSYVIRKALIRKHYLSRCIHNYLVKHSESVLRIAVPKTWDIELSFSDELDEMWSDDLFDLGTELDKDDPSKWWILKPGMADRGMGIRLFHSKDDLAEIFESFEQDDSDEEDKPEDGRGPDTAVATSQLRHFVIQVGAEPSHSESTADAIASCKGPSNHLLTKDTYRSISLSPCLWILWKCLWTKSRCHSWTTCAVTKSACLPESASACSCQNSFTFVSTVLLLEP